MPPLYVHEAGFQLIGPSWHVEKTCRQTIGTIIPAMGNRASDLEQIIRRRIPGGIVAVIAIVHSTESDRNADLEVPRVPAMSYSRDLEGAR